jgi:hypothetical protein
MLENAPALLVEIGAIGRHLAHAVRVPSLRHAVEDRCLDKINTQHKM